jgi:hypothetical protein
MTFFEGALAEEISISEAYQAIPHRQTSFDVKLSEMNAQEAEYLDHLFYVTDLAMRSRVVALTQLSDNNSLNLENYNKEIDQILENFEMFYPPKRLRKVAKTIQSAIQDQKSFINYWANSGIRPDLHNDHLVLSSHKKLLKAYSMLMILYPRETKHNKQSFYDHLCALDFI